uniref:Immunoglobulin V-set domain-containing protein n=1 Tax=Neolamprologus brichardi TaxID=32507 RepID=A0A3Q4M9R5_NEOBR
ILIVARIIGRIRVYQNPADMYKEQGQTADITCSHSIDSYDRILWYKQIKGHLQYLGYIIGNLGNPQDGANVTIIGNANKDQTCTLTIKDLTLNSSAVYFYSLHNLVGSRIMVEPLRI